MSNQKKKHMHFSIINKAIILLLSVFMTIPTATKTVHGESGNNMTVTAFAAYQSTYTVKIGTAQDQIGLPGQLSATVAYEDESGKQKTEQDALEVKWSSVDYDSSASGVYHFTAALSDSSISLSDLSLQPAVTVTVEAAEAKTITKFGSYKASYTVAANTDVSNLGLPSSIDAEIAGSDTASAAMEPIELSWDSRDYNSAVAGTYTFTAVPKDSSYAVAAETAMPKITVTVNDKPQAAPKKSLVPSLLGAANASGDDYVAGNAHISKMGLISSSSTVDSFDTTALTVKVGLALNDNSKYNSFSKASMNYRFKLARYLPSGGEVRFSEINSTWLQNYNVTTQVESGVEYYIATGTVNYSSAQIIPGEVQESLIVNVGEGLNGEKFNITGSSWLSLDGEAGSASAESADISIVSKPNYDLGTNFYDNNQRQELISGYYNSATNTFYLTEAEKNAAHDTGAVYGRFYQFSAIISSVDKNGLHTTGVDLRNSFEKQSERLNVSVPTTWKMSYEVDVTDAGGNTTAESGIYKPILVDSCNYYSGQKIKQGYIRNADTSLGGYTSMSYSSIADNSKLAGTETNSQTSNSVTFTATSTGEGKFAVETESLFFVPLNLSDTAAVIRELKVTLSSLDAVGRTGQHGTDLNLTDNVEKYTVLRKNTEGRISQEMKLDWDKIVVGGTERYHALLYVKGNVSDMGITACDQLVKFDASGAQYSNDYYMSRFSGEKSKVIKLFGTKKDGTNWSSLDEQFAAIKEDLLWYDSPEKVPSGSKVVAMLFETRGGVLTASTLDQSIYLMGTAAGTYAYALNTEVWRGNTTNTVTYAGTNGGALPPMNKPTDAIYSSEGGKYIKTEWNTDGTVAKSDRNGDLYGNTHLAAGYVVTGEASTVLNGTNPGTVGVTNKDSTGSGFNISNGERTAAMGTEIKIKWQGDTTVPDPKTELHLKVNSFCNNSSYFKQTGKVFVASADAEVKWDSTLAVPTFVSNDPSFKEIDPEDFSVNGGGKYVIYYSLAIGDSVDLSKDPSAGQKEVIFNFSVAPESKTSLILLNQSIGFVDKVSIDGWPTIIRNSIIGISKTSLEFLAAPSSVFGWGLSSSTAKEDVPNYSMIDVLPFNGDGRSTDIRGSYSLHDDSISIHFSTSSPAIASNLKIYYTVDPSIRTKGAGNTAPSASSIVNFDPANSLGVQWTEMAGTAEESNTATSATYLYKMSAADAGKTPTAIVINGLFAKNEMYYAELKFDDLEKGSSTYVNNASIDAASLIEHNIKSNPAPIQIISRVIDGTGWIDANHNSKMDDDEKRIPGIRVHLYTADGTEVTKDVYGNDLGSVTTDDKGRYQFVNVADNADGWYVTYDLSEEQKKEYAPSAIHANGESDDAASATDSDFEKQTVGKETVYRTRKFTMASYADQVQAGTLNDATAHDFGLQTATPTEVKLIGSKKLTENGNTKAIRDGQFQFDASADKNNDTSGYSGFTAGEYDVRSDGKFEIGTITFTKAGNYAFEISEKDAGAAGYTYDDKPVTVSVQVDKDEAANALKSIVTYEKDSKEVGEIAFANTYATPDPVTSSLAGTKTLTENGIAKQIEKDQFSFTVEADESNDPEGTDGFKNSIAGVMPDGAFSFGYITFTKAGNYKFAVKENDAKAAGYTYDQSKYSITYAVALNENTNKLEAVPLLQKNGGKADSVIFDNTYEMPDPIAVRFDGVKTLNKVQTGIKENQFTFGLEEDPANITAGYEMPKPAEASVKSDGTFSFGEIKFSLPGTYRFTAAENDLGVKDYKYDGNPVAITCTVTLNKKTNQYEADVKYRKSGVEADTIEFDNTYTPSNKQFLVTFLDCRGNTVKVEWVQAGGSATPPSGFGEYSGYLNVTSHIDLRPNSCEVNHKWIVPNTADK